jgi:hypothetical protein
VTARGGGNGALPVGPVRSGAIPAMQHGELTALVRQSVLDAPDDQWSPTMLARLLNRSQGAIANALERLTDRGEIHKVQDSPRRYQAPPPPKPTRPRKPGPGKARTSKAATPATAAPTGVQSDAATHDSTPATATATADMASAEHHEPETTSTPTPAPDPTPVTQGHPGDPADPVLVVAPGTEGAPSDPAFAAPVAPTTPGAPAEDG